MVSQRARLRNKNQEGKKTNRSSDDIWTEEDTKQQNLEVTTQEQDINLHNYETRLIKVYTFQLI